MKCFAFVVLFASVFGLVGCASGPSFESREASLPPLDPAKSRVFCYRSADYAGSAIRPDIVFDGRKVGSSAPGAVLVLDLPSGEHAFDCNGHHLPITLKGGEQRYIRFEHYTDEHSLSPLYRIRPTLVHPDQGREDIRGLACVGPQ